MTKKYLKFRDYLVEKLRDPDEANEFLKAAIEGYEEDQDTAALLLALRYLTEAKGGVPQLAKRASLNRQNLYKALTGKTEPKFNTVMSIIGGLGYRLTPNNGKEHGAFK